MANNLQFLRYSGSTTFETLEQAKNWANAEFSVRPLDYGEPFVMQYKDNGETKILEVIGTEDGFAYMDSISEEEIDEKLKGIIADANISTADTNIIIAKEDGVFASVDLKTEDGKLIFETSNGTKKTIDLSTIDIPSNAAITDGEYNWKTETIDLILGDGSKINIDVSDLIREWTIDEDNVSPVILSLKEVTASTSITRTTQNHQDLLSADLNIADKDYNILKKTKDGGAVYVEGLAKNIQYQQEDGTYISLQDAITDTDCAVSSNDSNIIYKKFDGLFASTDVAYDASTNTLTFKHSTVDGKTETKQFTLNSAKLLDDVSYDSSTETLVLRFQTADGNTSKISIPVTSIIKEWTVDNSSTTVTLTKEHSIAGTDLLRANVNISTAPYNIIENNGHALYARGTADNIRYDEDYSVEGKIKAMENSLTEKIEKSTTDNALSTEDSQTVSLSLSADNTLKANVAISNEDDNMLVKNTDGLYVKKVEATEIKVSSEADNALTQKTDGLYVPTVEVPEVEVSAIDGNAIVKKADGLYAPTVEVKVSTLDGNALTQKADGLYVKEVEVPEVKVSENDGNAIVEKADGLYVKKTTVSSIDGNALVEKADGLYVKEVEVPEVKISDEAGNALSAKTSGLYVPTVSFDFENAVLTYNKPTNTLTFTDNEGRSNDIELTGVDIFEDMYLQDDNLVLEYKDKNGDVQKVKVPVSSFFKGIKGTSDGNITVVADTLADASTAITANLDVDDIIATDNTTVALTKTDENKITANVNIAKNTDDNILMVDGSTSSLYVPGTAEHISAYYQDVKTTVQDVISKLSKRISEINVSGGSSSGISEELLEVIETLQANSAHTTVSEGENISVVKTGNDYKVSANIADSSVIKNLSGDVETLKANSAHTTVTINQELTTGTKIGTITVNGTSKDLYAPTPTPSTGGSTVMVSRDITSGTKIATISVDGVGNDLYAPTAETVSASATGTSGTKIGSVTVGSKTTDFYAPTAETVSASATGTTGTKIGSVTVGSKTTDFYAPTANTDVKITDTLTSGTKIGTLTIDGTGTDLYAPKSGDTVAVSQKLTEGTEAATITINGKQTTIYSTTATSVSFSQGQKSGNLVGTLTIDGVDNKLYAPAATGGSNVSVTPITTAGTQIATINVDGADTTLYAPKAQKVSVTGGSLTSGTLVGTINIDGTETELYAPKASSITIEDTLTTGDTIATINGTTIYSKKPTITSVTATQGTLSKGVKVGTVSVNGTDVEFFAPSATTVSVTQGAITSSTKGVTVGTITVGDTDTVLYAPSATTVSVSQKLTGGNEIGTVTINSVDTKLYAPADLITSTTVTATSTSNFGLNLTDQVLKLTYPRCSGITDVGGHLTEFTSGDTVFPVSTADTLTSATFKIERSISGLEKTIIDDETAYTAAFEKYTNAAGIGEGMDIKYTQYTGLSNTTDVNCIKTATSLYDADVKIAQEINNMWVVIKALSALTNNAS